MQTFFGPWSLRVVAGGDSGTKRLVIAGSSSADGVYPLDSDGAPTDLTVDGEEWTIDLQATIDGFRGWSSYPPERTTEVLPPHGLTVTLTADEELTDGDGNSWCLVKFLAVLVSLDPDLNPPWPAVPYDFTLPD